MYKPLTFNNRTVEVNALCGVQQTLLLLAIVAGTTKTVVVFALNAGRYTKVENVYDNARRVNRIV